jgi:hypothetical protein
MSVSAKARYKGIYTVNPSRMSLVECLSFIYPYLIINYEVKFTAAGSTFHLIKSRLLLVNQDNGNALVNAARLHP